MCHRRSDRPHRTAAQVRSTLESGHYRQSDRGPLTAKTGSRQILFDHLVGECQQGRRHNNAERFRGLEIDNEGKLARLLNREIAGLRSMQNFSGIDACMTHTVAAATEQKTSGISGNER